MQRPELINIARGAYHPNKESERISRNSMNLAQICRYDLSCSSGPRLIEMGEIARDWRDILISI